MTPRDIIRAWKDELFRKSLSEEAQAMLPAHPAGEMLLSEEEMASVLGGVGSEYCSICCNSGAPHTCAPLCQVV